jgi:hypothetical protein
MLLGVGADDGTVGQHYLRRDNVVDQEAFALRELAVAAAEREATDSVRRSRAPRSTCCPLDSDGIDHRDGAGPRGDPT